MVVKMSYEEAVDLMTSMGLEVTEGSVIAFINMCAEGVTVDFDPLPNAKAVI